MSIIAVDLGGTKLACAAFGEDGDIRSRDVAAVGNRRGHDIAALVVDRVRALLASAGRADGVRVGICVPGIYHARRGTVWAPNIPDWDAFPLRDVVSDALGPDAVLRVDSDRAAYILGETWRGAARGARDAIYLGVGTGIGAGILVDGRVVRGHGDIAGAIGWLALERPYRAEWGPHGCFEHQASGPGLVRVAHELMDADSRYTGALRQVASLTTADVFAAHDRGDATAGRVIDNAVALWGMATANLVSLFNPEIIVFGGGVFGPAAAFIDRIREEACRWAQPIAMQQVRLVASTLGGDAGLYGAAQLALSG